MPSVQRYQAAHLRQDIRDTEGESSIASHLPRVPARVPENAGEVHLDRLSFSARSTAAVRIRRRAERMDSRSEMRL